VKFNVANFHWLVIALLLQLVGQNAFAEGVLMDVKPKDNSVVSAFDNKVTLAFSSNVSERTPTLVVLDSTGTRVDNKDLSLTIGDRSILSATTRPLAAGRYVIRYRVVTKDGLVVSGICRFEIKA
jgi:methionine-rich copper-binding protein CopC